MYHLIRRIHLFTGLVLLIFVLMYFLTGYLLIHENWLGGRKPRSSSRIEPLNYTAPSDEALSKYLQTTFDLRGQAAPPVHKKDGSTRFNFSRPGTVYEAVVAAGGTQVTITCKQFGAGGVANGLHRQRGFRGGWMYVTWACFYDLASVALIVFALSGVLLWYRSVSRRFAGWICLTASFGFSVAMILYLVFSL